MTSQRNAPIKKRDTIDTNQKNNFDTKYEEVSLSQKNKMSHNDLEEQSRYQLEVILIRVRWNSHDELEDQSRNEFEEQS